MPVFRLYIGCVGRFASDLARRCRPVRGCGRQARGHRTERRPRLRDRPGEGPGGGGLRGRAEAAAAAFEPAQAEGGGSAWRRLASEQTAADLPALAASRGPSAGVAPMGASARSAVRFTPAAFGPTPPPGWDHRNSDPERGRSPPHPCGGSGGPGAAAGATGRFGIQPLSEAWVGGPLGLQERPRLRGADASWHRPCHL